MEIPTLEAGPVVLRVMRPSDEEGYARLLADPGTFPFVVEKGPVPRKRIAPRIRSNREAAQYGTALYWSVTVRGEFVGYIALHAPTDPVASLSYAILPEHRRRGYASAAIRAVCQYAGPEFRPETILALAHPENAASVALLKSLGFDSHGIKMAPRGDRAVFSWSPE